MNISLNDDIVRVTKTQRMAAARDSLVPGNLCVGLYQLIKKYYPDNASVVEIGSFEGVSTELFALTCGLVYSVDPYDQNDYPEQDGGKSVLLEAERRFVKRMKPYDNVTKMRMLSSEAVRHFSDGQLDAGYVDANHNYDSVVNDIEIWVPKIKKTGVISGHDYFDHIKQAVDDVIGPPNEVFCDSSWVKKLGV